MRFGINGGSGAEKNGRQLASVTALDDVVAASSVRFAVGKVKGGVPGHMRSTSVNQLLNLTVSRLTLELFLSLPSLQSC